MVEVEFNMDANEDTMAAANAAKANPLRPEGKNCKTKGMLYRLDLQKAYFADLLRLVQP